MVSQRPAPRPVTLDQLHSAVGAVFFVWSRMETALRQALDDLQPDPPKPMPHALSHVLAHWKKHCLAAAQDRPDHHDFLEDISTILSENLTVRNRVAHGFTGFGLGGNGHPPHILTDLNGTTCETSHAELRRRTAETACLAAHLGRITSLALHPERWTYSDLPTEIRTLLHRHRDQD